MKCEECGKQIMKDSGFCSYCGIKIYEERKSSSGSLEEMREVLKDMTFDERLNFLKEIKRKEDESIAAMKKICKKDKKFKKFFDDYFVPYFNRAVGLRNAIAVTTEFLIKETVGDIKNTN